MDNRDHWKKLKEISLQEDKTKGYGGASEKFIDPFLSWFKVITYKKGAYLVIDRYTGAELNIGQAVTFYRKKPIYGINYYGILLDKKLKAKIVFDFLKKALRAAAGKSDHRGLDGFKEDGYLYENKFTEKRGFVEGEERIFYNHKLIYIQVYHGGMLEDARSYREWSRKLNSSEELLKRLN